MHEAAQNQVLFQDLKRYLPLSVNAFRFNQQTLNIGNREQSRKLKLIIKNCLVSFYDGPQLPYVHSWVIKFIDFQYLELALVKYFTSLS
ncbi:hypothetical protein AFK68_23505 [Hydrocoleum sp. CS-953]|nr:hypothetical protein AFK68_23505 [Hydrocoleum sp. CS-953]